MSKQPASRLDWWPLNADQWLGSTSILLMTPAEEGGYVRLLCHAWNSKDCSLPNDPKQLASLSRLGRAWHRGSGEKILKCFEVRGQKLYNLRLEIEHKEARRLQKKRKAAGRAGAKVRWEQDLDESNADGKRITTAYDGQSDRNGRNRNRNRNLLRSYLNSLRNSNTQWGATVADVSTKLTEADAEDSGPGLKKYLERWLTEAGKILGPYYLAQPARDDAEKLAVLAQAQRDRGWLVTLFKHLYLAHRGETRDMQADAAVQLLEDRVGKKKLLRPFGSFMTGCDRRWPGWRPRARTKR